MDNDRPGPVKRIIQLEHDYALLSDNAQDIFWILLAQTLLLLAVAIMLWWDQKSQAMQRQDFFEGYHQAIHNSDSDDLLAPRSLGSRTGHPVVTEPIVVPPKDADEKPYWTPVEDDLHVTTEHIIPVASGKHRRA